MSSRFHQSCTSYHAASIFHSELTILAYTDDNLAVFWNFRLWREEPSRHSGHIQELLGRGYSEGRKAV